MNEVDKGAAAIDGIFLGIRGCYLATVGVIFTLFRAAFLYATFILPILIFALITYLLLWVQAFYPQVSAAIADNPVSNEAITFIINSAIELINGAFELANFFIELWDWLVPIFYMIMDLLAPAIDALLTTLFGTPSLQCIIGYLIEIAANILGDLLTAFFQGITALGRALQQVPPMCSYDFGECKDRYKKGSFGNGSHPLTQNVTVGDADFNAAKQTCSIYQPFLDELDLNNRQEAPAPEDDMPLLETINATFAEGLCSPSGGPNPAVFPNTQQNEREGTCPPNSKLVNFAISFARVLINLLAIAAEFLLATLIVFIKDLLPEIAIILPQFANLIGQILTELRTHGVFSQIIQIVYNILQMIAPIFNVLCPLFAQVGWFICSVMGFLSQALNSIVGSIACALNGQQPSYPPPAALSLPPPIETSIFNSNSTYYRTGETRAGRVFHMTVNRPSDYNLSQQYGIIFNPPSFKPYPQTVRINYTGQFSVPIGSTVNGSAAFITYMNYLRQIHMRSRSSIVQGIDYKHTFLNSPHLGSMTTSSADYVGGGPQFVAENDTAEELTSISVSSSNSQCCNNNYNKNRAYNTYGMKTDQTLCTDASQCAYVNCTTDQSDTPTANNYPGENCGCPSFCNPNIMTNKPNDVNNCDNPVCSNPTGICNKLPGQYCPTSTAFGQFQAASGAYSDNGKQISCPCESGGTNEPTRGCNVVQPCYGNAPCFCHGSGDCGANYDDVYKSINECVNPGSIGGNLHPNSFPIPNLNGPITCKIPRSTITVEAMVCICQSLKFGMNGFTSDAENQATLAGCAFGGYFCINWSTSANTFVALTPPPVPACAVTAVPPSFKTFIKSLHTCFEEQQPDQSLFGSDLSTDPNVCGDPANPSGPEDDSDMNQVPGVPPSLIYNPGGDRPVGGMPKSDSYKSAYNDPNVGYCPAGNNNMYGCKANTTNQCTSKRQGGADDQALPSATGVSPTTAAGPTGTRCKMFAQMCSCIYFPAGFNASGNITNMSGLPSVINVTFGPCANNAIMELNVLVANLAKNIFNLEVDVLRVLPAITGDTIKFLFNLGLDVIQWIVDFAFQEGVVMLSLLNSAELSKGMGHAFERMTKSDYFQEFKNSPIGMQFLNLSRTRLPANASCAAFLNGTPGASFLNCPEAVCFMLGDASLCCSPPVPSNNGEGNLSTHQNMTGMSNQATGRTIEETISTQRRFCISGGSDTLNDVNVRYSMKTYRPRSRFTQKMIGQALQVYRAIDWRRFYNNNTDFVAYIRQLELVSDIVTGVTQVYTPDYSDIPYFGYDGNRSTREYQYFNDDAGVRSALGILTSQLVGGAMYAQIQAAARAQDRLTAANSAQDVDQTAGCQNVTEAMCQTLGVHNPCCRCMTINGQCRANTKNPTCCCHAGSSVYDCCLGLPGCIRPIFTLRIPKILNVDWLANVNDQTCAYVDSGPKSLLFIFRLLLSTPVTKFIKDAPTAAMRNFYQTLLGWLTFPGNQLPPYALVCFLFNLGGLFLMLFIFFLVGLLWIAASPWINEVWDYFFEVVEEAQIVGDEMQSGQNQGSIMNPALLQAPVN
jgi:hypothetical protein